MKVILCVPTLTKPHDETLSSIAASVPYLDSAGIEHGMVSEVGCPYISAARATMLRKALDAKADVVVFIDHDVSWYAQDLLTLIETPGDVVAGTYRFKHEPEEYMGRLLSNTDGTPMCRKDGAIYTFSAPAGFLKVTKDAINRFIAAYPELLYGDRYSPSIDLFNHGAHEFVWIGEDYSFCRRWLELGGEILTVPTLHINHHAGDTVYPGCLHDFLLCQPGGSEFKGETNG